MILDGDGVRLERGLWGVRRIGWTQINPDGCEVVPVVRRRKRKSESATEEPKPGEAFEKRDWSLRLALRGGGSVVAATSHSPEERECLAAVCEAVRAARWGKGGEETAPGSNPAPVAGTEILRCSKCQAPLAPVDAPEARCHFCGTTTVLSEGLRNRIQAVGTLSVDRRRLQTLAVSVLRTPLGRQGQSRALGLALAHPRSSAARLEGAQRKLRGFLVALLIALLFLTRVRVADRSAVRHLTLHFGARRPERAGDPYLCRDCGAPLPSGRAEQVVVCRCVYCEADNVLGLDLRREAGAAARERRELEQAFKLRNGERRVGFRGFAIAGSIAALGLWLWIPSLGTPALASEAQIVHDAQVATLERYQQRCNARDLEGCSNLGTLFEKGQGVRQDYGHAFALYERACKGGVAMACDNLGCSTTMVKGHAELHERRVALRDGM